MQIKLLFSNRGDNMTKKVFSFAEHTQRLFWKKRALALSALLVLSQVASPIGIIIAYAAPTTSNEVGSSAALDPVGNKATRLQTQGSSGVDQSTGAFTYSYPLVIPNGRQGMSPKLSLSYNSQSNDSGWLGHGWALSIPYIERTPKTGTDKMYSNPAFVSSLHGELNSANGVSYEQKIDDGSYSKYTFTGNSWQMTDRDGTTYYFGNIDSSRTNDASSTKIGRWYITETRDKFGNGIIYKYTKNYGTVYPSSISYTEHALAHPLNLVTFNLESKSDQVISYKYGFRTIDTKRISSIKVSTNGRDNSYFSFSYTTGSNGTRSLLQSVEEKHLSTNDDWTNLPKTMFEYENSPISLSGTISNSLNPYGSNVIIDTNNDGIQDLYNAGDGYVPIDINGDYKKDLMQSDVTYGVYSNGRYINFRYNQGGSFFLRSLTTPSSPAYLRSMAGGATPPLRYMGEGQWWWTQESAIADVNGDGFDDIVYNDPYGTNGVAINTGNNTFDYVNSSSLGFIVSSDQIIDVNGDGFQDKIVKSYTATSTLFSVYLNNGTSYSSSPEFIYDAQIASSSYDIGVRFVDVNNDGLIDVVRSYSSTYAGSGNPVCSDSYGAVPGTPPINQTVNRVAINTGSGFVNSSSTLSGYIIAYSGCDYFFTNGYLVTKESKAYDINGDLTTDYDSATNNTLKQDILKKITNSLGSTLEVSYTWTTKTGFNPNLPVPTYIVATTTDKLSVSDTNPHNIGYNFYGAQMYFDANNPRDHKFAGFAHVDVIEGNNKTVTYYHQGNGDDYTTGEKGDSYYNIGRPYRTDTFDLSGGLPTLVSKNLSLYTTYSYASSSFTYLDSQISNVYNSNGTFLSSGSKNVYDETKRLIKTSYNYSDIEPFISFASSTIADKGTDIITTHYDYSNSRPQRLIKQTSTDYAGNNISNISYYYDNLPLGLVDKGAVTNVINTVYDNDGSINATSSTKSIYDATGNVIQITDNLNHITKIIYDSGYFFPTIKLDALNSTTTFTFDPYTLNLLSTKGPDGIAYINETDGLGKVTRSYTINTAGGINNDTRTTYVYGGGISVYTRKIGNSGTNSRTFQAYDSFGRLIQSKTETSSDVFSTQDTKYDASSNVISTSLLYTTTGYGLTTDTPSNGSIVYVYDGLGRVITKSSFGTTLSYQYGARSLTVQDNASTQHKKSYAYDVNGNLSQVNEYNGGDTYRTNYNYTPFNKLSRITDTNGNIRNFSYLTNGSLNYQEDLHTPTDTTFTTYSYAYDSLGNLITKAGQLGTTTYAYDVLNRPVTRTLSDVNYGTSTVGITYTGCSNNYSSPCTINRSTSSTTLAYNVSGKLSSESLSIDGNTFTRSYEYDTFGNPTTITYPDNGKTVYTYTLDGKQSMLSYITPSGANKNIVTNSTYNSLGALSSLSFGNGVQMCNTYTNTSTDGTISPKLAKSTYLFNSTGCSAVANQIELYKDEFTHKDNITPSSVLSTYKDIAGTTHTKSDTFTYDNLARLTQVSTSYDGGSDTNNALTYDPIGNILKENDVLYRYSQDGTQNVHAVTSVGGTHIDYDAQGNRIQVGDSSYAWNALNQMVSATSTNGTEFYTYDENGERIKKVIQTTLSINQKVTPSTSSSTLNGFRFGDLLAQVTTSSTYIAASTYNTLLSLSLLSTSTLTTLVSNYYSSPFTSKFCATATSTSNRQNCIVTTTQQLLANNINSRSTSTVATTGLVNDVIKIVTGAYLIPATYTGLATSSIVTSATTTFSINSGTISSYNTYVGTGIVVPMAEYANLPYVSSSTYTTLAQVGLTDTSKVRALLTLAGCNSVSSACTTAERVVFERTYKNSGYLLSDKVLQEMWYVFAAKARLPGNSSEFTPTSTTLGSITIPAITGISTSSATSTYYSGLYFTTEYTNQNVNEPRLQFFNTIPYYVTQSAFVELQQAGITQTTVENYQALIGDLFGIKTSSSTEYMTAITSFVQYDKRTTLSYNAIKELYLVVLGAAAIPNNINDYTATSIFDLGSYLTINSYQYNGYTGTWPFYNSGCYAGYYTGSGSDPWTRCVITTSSFTLPVATSSTVSYILTVSKTPQPTEWPLVVGNSASVSGGINQVYTSTVASDGSHLDADVSPTIVARLLGSTSTVMVVNSHEFVTGNVYPYQAESVVLKAYVNTPRLTLASTTLVSNVPNATTSEYTTGIQSSIASYFGEIYDSSNDISLNSYTKTSSLPRYTLTGCAGGFYSPYSSRTNISYPILYDNNGYPYQQNPCTGNQPTYFSSQTLDNSDRYIWLISEFTDSDNHWWSRFNSSDDSQSIQAYTDAPLNPAVHNSFTVDGRTIHAVRADKMINCVNGTCNSFGSSFTAFMGNNPNAGNRFYGIISTNSSSATYINSQDSMYTALAPTYTSTTTTTYSPSSPIVYISLEAYNEFASTTLKNAYDISKIFLATTTSQQCIDSASTTECDKQQRETFFRQTIGNLSGFIPSQAATEEFWMIHKGLLLLPSASSSLLLLYGSSTHVIFVNDATTTVSVLSRSQLPSTLATSTAITAINLNLVPVGLLNDLQFNTLYSSSTFALATSTRIVSEDTYNELLHTPIRINSDVDTVFNYALPSATSSCSGQSATSSCVINAMKTTVKNTISALSGFVLSDAALEEMYRAYSNQLSIIPMSLVNASATTTTQTITLPLNLPESFTTFSTTAVGTSTIVSAKNSTCSFGTSGATTSLCYIDLPYINSSVANLIFSYDVSTSSVATSTVITTLTYITQTNVASTTSTSTPTFTTTIATSTIMGQKVTGTKFTFNLTSLYQTYLNSSTPKLTLTPDANGTSSSIYSLSNPSLSITRTIVVPKISYMEFGTLVSGTTTYTQAISTSSLHSYYKLDDVSGNASDSTGNGNTLINTGGLTYGTGKINSGLQGGVSTSKYMSTSTNMGYTSSGSNTWTTWVKINSFGSGGYILDNNTTSGNTRMIIYYGTNNIRLFANGNEITTGTLTTGTWYHVAVKHTGSTYELFLNGASQGTVSAGNLSYPYNFFVLTNSGPTGGLSDDETVDEVSTWTRALSSSEIYTLYNSGVGLTHPFQIGTASPSQMVYGLNTTQPIPFDRSTIPTFATSTATTSIDLTSAPTTLDFSMVFASPVGRISSGNSTSYTASVIATSSIVGYYKLDESSGNPSDSSSNAKTLTNTGTVAYTPGKINNSAVFNSSNKRLGRTTDNMGYTTTSSNTWSFWVNPTTLSGYMFDNYTQSGGQRRAIVYIDGSASKFRTWLSGTDNAAVGPAISTGNWYHVALVNNAGTYTLYVNGVSYGTQGSGTSGGALDQFAFGAASDSWGANANAKFDEVSVWSRALSSAEIANLYNSAQGIQYPFQISTTDTGSSTSIYAGSYIDTTYSPLPTIPQVALPPLNSYPFSSTTSTSTLFTISSSSTTEQTTYTPFDGYSYNLTSGVITTYFKLNGVLVGSYTYQQGNESSGGMVNFVATNYLGTPVLETDDKGDIVQMDITDVFGNYVQRDQRNDNAYHNKGYTSHEFDDVTGLTYAHARYLATPMHSFLSVDPVIYGLAGGDSKLKDRYLQNPQEQNSYAYALNNPIIFTDPTGLFNLKTGEVEKGDTLSEIVKLLNKTNGTNYTVSTFQSLNSSIKDVNKIYAGQVLIPNQKVPDITSSLTTLMQTNAKDSSINSKVYGISNFKDKVQTGGVWDFKNDKNSPYYANNGKDSYVFNGAQVGKDAPSNIHYGYVGYSTWWGGERLLLRGAGAYQVYSNARSKDQDVRFYSTLGNIPYFDNLGDTEQIRIGIDYRKAGN